MSTDYDKDGNMKLRRRIKFNHRTKVWKRKVIERDGKCMKCGTTEKLTAHHTIQISVLIRKYKLRTIEDAYKCKELWDISLGECLCEEHHTEVHRHVNIQRTIDKGWKLVKRKEAVR